MKTLRLLSGMILALVFVVIVGCGGSGAATYGDTSASQMFTIVTTATDSSGVSGVWDNAAITGAAAADDYTCDIYDDPNCIVYIGTYDPITDELLTGSIPGFNTGSSGEAYFGTEASDATWTFNAASDGFACTAQTTVTWDMLSGLVPLQGCSSITTSMEASPGSCVIEPAYTIGTVHIPARDTCTATVTVSFAPALTPSSGLPLKTALVAADYSDTGTNLAQSGVTASTTASVVVPTPTTYGTTYLAVGNAAGDVYGVAEFIRTYITPPSNPCASVAEKKTGASPDAICED
jgi:hypothetical protein